MMRVVRAAAPAFVLAFAPLCFVAQQQTETTAISTLMQDAQTLAANGIAFGFVLGRDDSLSMQVWRPARPATAAVSRRALISGFSGDWRERFHIAEADGVLSAVSTRGSICVSALQRRVKPQTVVGSPVEVLFAMMRELDPALQRLPPPGVVSGGGAAAVAVADPITTVFTVPVFEGSLGGGLDRIVSTAHHLGWMASEECGAGGGCGCVVTFVAGTSVARTFYDITRGTR